MTNPYFIAKCLIEKNKDPYLITRILLMIASHYTINLSNKALYLQMNESVIFSLFHCTLQLKNLLNFIKITYLPKI